MSYETTPENFAMNNRTPEEQAHAMLLVASDSFLECDLQEAQAAALIGIGWALLAIHQEV